MTRRKPPDQMRNPPDKLRQDTVRFGGVIPDEKRRRLGDIMSIIGAELIRILLQCMESGCWRSKTQHAPESPVNFVHDVRWYFADPIRQVRLVERDKCSDIDNGVAREPHRYSR